MAVERTNQVEPLSELLPVKLRNRDRHHWDWRPSRAVCPYLSVCHWQRGSGGTQAAVVTVRKIDGSKLP